MQSTLDEGLDSFSCAEAQFEPLNGSWLAELEDAKEALSTVQEDEEEEGKRRPRRTSDDHPSAALLLDAYLRLCRAHFMLRQWERLYALSKKASHLLSSIDETKQQESGATDHHKNRGEEDASRTVARRRLREYRKRARTELSAVSALRTSGVDQHDEHGRLAEFRPLVSIYDDDNKDADGDDDDEEADPGGPVNDQKAFIRRALLLEGLHPDIQRGPSPFRSLNIFQDSALRGDVRLMEEMVALGASIDCPFHQAQDNIDEQCLAYMIALATRYNPAGSFVPGKDYRKVPPRTSSALLMICVQLAMAESTDPALESVRRHVGPEIEEIADKITECAMQLVRLGADPNRRLDIYCESDPPHSGMFWLPVLHNKSAFQIAAMTKRRPLVALMWDHMQLSPEERAQIVHCRCGSRLPWKQCHSTGAGQPPHYVIGTNNQTYYRVSPRAQCPCGLATKTYYKCCWNDNSQPSYMDDRTGFHFAPFWCPARLQRSLDVGCTNPDRIRFVDRRNEVVQFRKDAAQRFRESPSTFQNLWADACPKSRMATWDRFVYAGCLDRLGLIFLWRDVHWDLDREDLLWRAGDWNKALQKYCDDMNLTGEERERVVDKHTANPCGPCGYVNCDAFETEAREFQRCARCKRIAYCGRTCQKKDWAVHQTVCMASSPFDPEPGVAWPKTATASSSSS